MSRFYSRLYTFASGFAGALMLVGMVNANVIAQATSANNTGYVSNFNWFQATVLGMVQGLTEFLPISSTAHLKAVPVALGWGDPGVAFTAEIQLGSIIAVLWYFWQDLTDLTIGIIKAVKTKNYQTQEFKIGAGILIGTIPIVILGLGMKLFISDLDNSAFRSMTTIALASIVMAILLGSAEMVGNHRRNFEGLSTKDGILMGIAQALALIPGVSRSGSTITSGLFLNLDRTTAARFSFLLGIPAITLAGLVELQEVFTQGSLADSIIPLIFGLISSAVFSYLAISWLIRYLQTQNTWVFVWYRLAFGIIILSAIATNRI